MLTALRETWANPGYATLCIAFSAALGVTWCRLRAQRAQTERERRGREELEAYARLDLRVSSHGDLKSLPRRVCSVIAARSPFDRVAVLMYGPGGDLYIAATEGMDDPATQAIEEWLVDQRSSQYEPEYGDNRAQVRLGSATSVVRIKSEDHAGGLAVLVPIRSGEGKLGALLVLANNILEVPHRLAEEAVIGLEVLATRLGYALEEIPPSLQLLAFESKLGSERYLHSEPFSMEISTPAGGREELGIV